jgi:hypothetical protein
VSYTPTAESLKDVWIALRPNIRAIREHVTFAEIAAQTLPKSIENIADMPTDRE